MLQDLYQKMSQFKKTLAKAGVLSGALLITTYALFRAYYINLSPSLAIFAILLYIAELHTIILMYGFLYSLWPRNYKKYIKENRRRDLQINMFVTIAGEPYEVVTKTIKAAKGAAEYYNKRVKPINKARVVVLNDGRGAKKPGWEKVEEFCHQVNVEHLARENNEGFKAGNINNALKVYASEDPHNTIDCFFDSDFCAKPHFLREILKPLLDDNVDFVQSPQRYHNLDTWVAKGAGAHQIFFFDYMCPAKAYDNALFLCGTNYAIRRKALLDAGGVDKRFVTEDYATSIKLHLQGNKGVFIPNILATGLAPMNLKEYFNQQTRWCKGCLDANGKYIKELFFGPLNWRQKFHYFISTAYYFIGIRDLILVLAPIPYLFWGISLIRSNSTFYLAYVYLPLVIFNFLLFGITFRNPVKSLVLDIVSFPVFALAFISSVIKRNIPFSITVKKYEKENPFIVYRIQLAVALVLFAGLLYSFILGTAENIGSYVNYFWASYSASFLFLGFALVVRENYEFKFIRKIQPTEKQLAYAKVISVFALAYLTGVSIPFVFDTAAKTPSYIVNSAPIQNTLSVVDLDVKQDLLVPSEGVYYGYYRPAYDSHPREFDVKLDFQDNPSLAMYYQDWSEDALFNTRFMNDMYKKGVIPVVTWEPIDDSNPSSSLNVPGKTAKAVLSGEYDDHIRSWAQDARRFRKPIFVRFAHEMNGNWYPWGDLNEDSALEYRKMWGYVHFIFAEEEANNVVWLWSPNNTNHYGLTEGVLDFYPGDAYVDWVGYSAFNWGDANYKKSLWRKFDYMSYNIYNELTKLNKPIMVAETSSVSKGGDKAFWFRQTLGIDIPKMSKIKAVVLFDHNYKNADFELESGMERRKVWSDVIYNSDFFIKEPLISKSS